MKTFKQFITEVEMNTSVSKTKRGFTRDPNAPLNRGIGKHFKKIGSFGNSDVHHSYHAVKGGKMRHHYAATDKVTGKVHKVLTTKKTKIHGVETIDALKGSDHKDKAHELYHHLITKHNKTFVTNMQSPGGHAVWKKLSKAKGVKVHGYDNKLKKGVHFDATDHSDTHASVHDINTHMNDGVKGSGKEMRHLDHIRTHISLVAHKK